MEPCIWHGPAPPVPHGRSAVSSATVQRDHCCTQWRSSQHHVTGHVGTAGAGRRASWQLGSWKKICWTISGMTPGSTQGTLEIGDSRQIARSLSCRRRIGTPSPSCTTTLLGWSPAWGRRLPCGARPSAAWPLLNPCDGG